MKNEEMKQLWDIALDEDMPMDTRKQALKLLSADFKVTKAVKRFVEKNA